MGAEWGHVATGFTLFVIGFWHLLNHIKLHVQNPKTFHSLPWFPSTKIRYIELYIIMLVFSMFIASQIIVGPFHHQPFDTDGTISNHLPSLEHSLIGLMFVVYAGFGILLDKFVPIAQYELTQLLSSILNGQLLFLFHLHSVDQTSLEGHYHMLLKLLFLILFITNLMCIGYRQSFVVGLIRSISLFFLGLWLVVMGFMLWTSSLIPKGCFLNREKGLIVARCHGEEALKRAKSLVNIEFSLYLIGVTIFAISLYLAMYNIYGEKVKYQTLTKYHQEQVHEDIEAQRKLEDHKAFF